MINATVAGNVGKDGELQMRPSGTPILKFSVASSTKVKGEEQTTWVNCAMFGDRASKIAPYIKKGGQVAVAGTLSLRSYQKADKSAGVSLDMNVNDVKLMGGKSDQPRERTPAPAPVAIDDIPF